MIELIIDRNEKKRIVRYILESLRDWFEIDKSREKYISDCAGWTFLASKEEGAYTGFLCLKETGKDTIELAVIGVLKDCQHKGVGRQLLEKAKELALSGGYSFMQVKTVQMGKYPEYDLTNRFYIACGFKEFEVFPTYWDAENPCQIYVMSLK